MEFVVMTTLAVIVAGAVTMLPSAQKRERQPIRVRIDSRRR